MIHELKLNKIEIIENMRAFARVRDPEPEHSRNVVRNSLALFDALNSLHNLGERERFLLEAASLMHDIGYANRPLQHNKGSRDLILACGVEGLPEIELKIIACIARYHRGVGPFPTHKVYRDLNDPEQKLVCKLAAILRIADGMDRSHSGNTLLSGVELLPGEVVLQFQGAAALELDAQAASRKADLFATAYEANVSVCFKG
jgi:exopolyphosphatase/guanosine-5'-triphosphate,3'-diphosphate pyrophosphatase